MAKNQCRRRTFVLTSGAAFVPFLTGGCGTNTPPPTPPPGDTTLLNKTIASAKGFYVLVDTCATPAGGERGFFDKFNASADKLVTVQVTGPVTNSRPQIQVKHIGDQVANTGNAPTTQSNTTTFTPTASQVFTLEVQECADVPIGSVYTVLVTQAP